MSGLLSMITVVVCTTLVVTAAGAPAPASSSAQHRPGKASSEDDLLQAIANGLGSRAGEAFRRFADDELPGLEAELRPAVAALPASVGGKLSPTAVRYVLHRLLLRRRGWHVKGLAPRGQAWNGTSPSGAALLAGLPMPVHGAIERELAGPGLGLRGVATLAALLEHLVYEEEGKRLRAILQIIGVPLAGSMGTEAAQRAIEFYATSYILDTHPSTTNEAELTSDFEAMQGEHSIYPNWPNIQKSLEAAIEREAHEGVVDFAGLEHVVRQMVNSFWKWQEPACLAMKQGLLGMEDRGTGRVRLADFYSKALHEGKWQLSESVAYLRTLGALDESNPSNLRVVIPNYLYGASNCLATSEYLSVCCVSECEGLLSHLERGLGAAEAPAESLAALVAALPSSSVPANRSLSTVMLHRLNWIAASHGGQVPLHGRLFAQWLHHAYPRECPYPHLAGQTRPLEAEDWMRYSGKPVSASPLAMAEHTGDRNSTRKRRGPLEGAAWSYEEELFVPRPSLEPAGLVVLHGAVYAAAAAVLAFSSVLARMARAWRRAVQASQSVDLKKEGTEHADSRLWTV